MNFSFNEASLMPVHYLRDDEVHNGKAFEKSNCEPKKCSFTLLKDGLTDMDIEKFLNLCSLSRTMNESEIKMLKSI